MSTESLQSLQSLVEERSNPDEEIRTDSEESTRTTFNISKDAVNGLSWLADYYGATQKRILNHVLRVLGSMKDEEAVAEAVQEVSPDNPVRKSVAIDPDTRTGLNDMSDEMDVSRDRLIEVGIQLAKFFAEKNMEKQREDLDKIRKFYEKADELEGELRDDTLYRGFGRVVGILIDIIDHAEHSLDNEKSIDLPF
jgi:hypothetical protein